MNMIKRQISILIRIIIIRLKYFFRKKPTKKALFYLGAHLGNGLGHLFLDYEKCYVFEADPKHFNILKKIFKNYPSVELFNVAVSDHDGEIEFHITSNNGGSSSVGTIKKEWGKSHNIFITKTIKVPCISLLNFIKKHKIDYIDDYISDLQGYDLHVLKSVEPLLKAKKIKNITSEVIITEGNKIYPDLPDNSEAGFNKLLGANYKCVAKGWGMLTDGKFEKVPDYWEEHDCKWQVVS